MALLGAAGLGRLPGRRLRLWLRGGAWPIAGLADHHRARPVWPERAALRHPGGGLAWSALALAAVALPARGPAKRWPAGAFGTCALSLVALGLFRAQLHARRPGAMWSAACALETVGSGLVLLARCWRG